MRPEAFAYVAAGAGNGRTLAANRAAFDGWRIVPRMLRDVEHRDTSVELFGQRLAEPVPARAGRRARARPRRGGLRGRASRPRHGHDDGVLQPGVEADGGPGPDPRGLPALVPAVLEPVGRARREPRDAGRAVRMRSDRGHARHDDARLAHARPRGRIPAVPARQGDRAVHERPRVPAADHRRGRGVRPRPARSRARRWPRSAR